MGDSIEPPVWDLTPLVESHVPEDVKKSMDDSLEQAEAFERKYKGRIKDLAPADIHGLYKELDSILTSWRDIYRYAFLLHSQDGEDRIANDLHEYSMKIRSEIDSKIVFFDIEISRTLVDRPEIIQHPDVEEYRHALEKAIEKGKYLLSERDEKLIAEKDLHGIDSWSLLQQKLRGTRKFKVVISGEEKELGISELLTLAERSPQREMRKEILEKLFKAISIDRMVIATALKCVFGDYLTQVKRRGYPSVLTHSLLDNDISQSTLDALITSMRDNIPLIRKYLELRAEALGLEKLAGYDMNARMIVPITEDQSNIPWSEAKRLVIESYSEFDREAGEFIADLFESRRIDGGIRPGKSGSVFCSSFSSPRTSYISIPYNGTLLGITYLAHECGHGLQNYYIYERHQWTNSLAGSCLAETGSTFGQMLVIEKFLKESKDEITQLAALDNVLCSIFITVYHILNSYIFELSVFNAMENNEIIDAEKLDELWRIARTEVFGDTIDWLPGMEQSWMLPPHFYIPRYRFYNYPYAFGQLLVLALLGLYNAEGESFVPKMKRILSAGGSESPKTLLAEVGLDLNDPKFWEIGFNQAYSYLDKFEEIVKKRK